MTNATTDPRERIRQILAASGGTKRLMKAAIKGRPLGADAHHMVRDAIHVDQAIEQAIDREAEAARGRAIEAERARVKAWEKREAEMADDEDHEATDLAVATVRAGRVGDRYPTATSPAFRP